LSKPDVADAGHTGYNHKKKLLSIADIVMSRT